ncbi:hypothetical protein NL676_018059 [Syzygium grande]|nr:hypothetical protein NL676_018059 [Syzygium grande]
MARIKHIKARQISDSRGNSMIENQAVKSKPGVPRFVTEPGADVIIDDGTFARAAVPSDGYTRIYEAVELSDDGSDYLGKGVSKAVENVNNIIAPALVGMDPTEQAAIDNFMVQQLDGTENELGWCKQKLGAETILVVSLAVCKAGAAVKRVPLYEHIANLAGNSKVVLPVPAFIVINRGSHAGNKVTMQEFMILPVGASSFKEAMKMGVEVYDHLKALIKQIYGQAATNVRDAGGFIKENEEGLELLKKAIENADYTDKNNDGSQKIPGDALGNVYKSFVSDYAIASIEDPFDQDDLEHYARMTDEIGEHVQIVGGDLLGTNLVRLEKAINEKTCNALLLKADQIGSVTETIEAVKRSKAAGWGVMASCGSLGQQRSIANTLLPKVGCFSECTKLRIGETEDAFIADLSVGLATGQIKTGAPRRAERRAKYNRVSHDSVSVYAQLLQIEKELGTEAVYAGADFRKPRKEKRPNKCPGIERSLSSLPTTNEKETEALGSHNRVSWRHVLFKVRSEVWRFLGSDDHIDLPQTCRCDLMSYAQNSDHGRRSSLFIEAY